ncbi:MAG: class II fructose-bisphosphate aldolase [Caldilineales bacterium]|nr:class II fructose-bisphosphate aldolase [Caldilineales bacterium]
MSLNSTDLMNNANHLGLAVPAFNIPYLTMMEPVIQAIIDEDSFGLIETARLEWYKFEAKGPDVIAAEFAKYADPDHMRLHLDHVPVIDEDDVRVDFLPVIKQAIDLGYQSVMIDGSRLSLTENIDATRQVAELAHAASVPCEAELGAVLGHEAGPPPPYEELFATGKGFTDVDEARQFVQESGCDWLSAAVGNIHGAISGALRDQKKVEARLDIEHIKKIRAATGVPLVLHGGSGIQRPYLLEAIQNGMTKVNIGTEIRQAYELGWRKAGDIGEGQQACYERTRWVIRDYFNLTGTRDAIFGEAD